MKVTTDGCLFGAIVAQELSGEKHIRVLDIGTGTALLSLMVAQENNLVQIDAVDIDKTAAAQAKENIDASPWKNSIEVKHLDILQYQPGDLYDVVISNPPFYEKQLSSPKAGRQLAHHSSELTLVQLFDQVKVLLKPTGEFYVLLPFYRTEEAKATARTCGLYPEKTWLIKQSVKHDFFRTVFCFSTIQKKPEALMELAIRDERNDYTPAFTQLLKPYYLKV